MRYEEFEANYKAPTKIEYVKHLLTIPTMADAVAWSEFRMGRGPMTEEEYQGYMTMTDDMEWNKLNADSINRLRCRTAFGFYLSSWFRFFIHLFTYRYSEFVSDDFSYRYELVLSEQYER